MITCQPKWGLRKSSGRAVKVSMHASVKPNAPFSYLWGVSEKRGLTPKLLLHIIPKIRRFINKSAYLKW